MRTACLAAAGAIVMLAACGGAAPADTVTVQETVTEAAEPERTGAGGTGVDEAAPEPQVDPADPKEGTTSYEVYGNSWGGYSQDEKLGAAEAYLADHPGECGSADAQTLASFVDESYGRDFPLSARASKLMRHLCGLAATGD